MCTGACLESAAQNWGELGLGPTPHYPPAAGLAPAAPVAPQPSRTQPSPRAAYACDMRECMHDLQKLQVINNQINFYPIVQLTLIEPSQPC